MKAMDDGGRRKGDIERAEGHRGLDRRRAMASSISWPIKVELSMTWQGPVNEPRYAEWEAAKEVMNHA